MPDDDGLIELRPPAAGRMEPTTWGAVAVGHIVRDQKDRMHTVVDEANGWVKLEAVLDRSVQAMPKPPADRPVEIYVPSDEECEVLLTTELGAFLMRDIEQREHTIARRLTWRMDPMPRKAKGLRDHLDMIHAVNVEDVLRKYNGTEVNPASKTQKKKALDELAEVHDMVHADPHAWPMGFPHHHSKET